MECLGEKDYDYWFFAEINGDVFAQEEGIGCKTYDTILVANIENSKGIMTYTYIDQNGRTVLWRRFNKNDWAYKNYKQKWSEKLPQKSKVYQWGYIRPLV